jgi:hypothetical protein
MQLTARLSASNPPEVAGDAAWVAATLGLAGIYGGDYSTPAGVDLALALSTAQSIITDVGNQDLEQRGHGWASFPADLCGDFQSNYAMRAYVALDGYMQLQATEALYPFYVAGGELFSNQSYTVEFSGKPQVNGFWSLTVYDEDGYLVDNDLNVYSLNNRDNITYTDGSRVRESPPDSSAPFYMLLQSTDYRASADWESK